MLSLMWNSGSRMKFDHSKNVPPSVTEKYLLFSMWKPYCLYSSDSRSAFSFASCSLVSCRCASTAFFHSDFGLAYCWSWDIYICTVVSSSSSAMSAAMRFTAFPCCSVVMLS